MWNIWIDPRGGADIFPQEELSQLQTVGATGMARVFLPRIIIFFVHSWVSNNSPFTLLSIFSDFLPTTDHQIIIFKDDTMHQYTRTK